MGWDAGFSRTRKYDEMTLNDYLNIREYLEWEDNEWAQEHYPNYCDYWRSMNNDTSTPPMLNERLLKQVKDNEKHFDEFDRIVYDYDIEKWSTWYSHDILDGFICEHLTKHDEDGFYYTGITKEFIEEGFKWVNEQLADCRLIPVEVKYSFRYTKDEEINLLKCDGIEVEDPETGNTWRIETNVDNVLGENIWVASDDYCDEKKYVLDSFKECLTKLSQLDLDKELIWYWRSY